MNKAMQGKVFKAIVRKEISKIGAALADPNRIEILDILSQGEQNVEQITRSMKLQKGIVSHHLQTLKNANLAAARKEGRYVFYSMPESALQLWNSLNQNSQLISTGIMWAMNSFFDKTHEFINVDYEGLLSRAMSGDVVVIDVRPEREFALAHFPGALSVPLESLQSKMREFPKNKKIIAYCRGSLCILAENAVKFLRAENYEAYRWKESVLDWKNLQDSASSSKTDPRQ